MLLSSSIIFGFLRLCLMLLILYYLNSKLIRKDKNENFLLFIVYGWFRYGSISVILIFILVQLGFYNLLNFLFVFLILLLLDYIGLKNIFKPGVFFKEKINRNFLNIVKKIDLKNRLFDVFVLEGTKETNKERYFMIFVGLFLMAMAFISRYYFYDYDTYLLSDLWFSELEKTISFNDQVWFGNEVSVVGEHALINFYGKLTDVSPEVALQSASIFENMILSIVLFFTIRNITLSQNFAAIVAFFSFLFLYTFSPIEISYLLQNEAFFLGLSLAIPSMVFILKPEIINFKKVNYFLSYVFVAFAIGLIDLFTLLILMPPFLLLALIFVPKDYKTYKWIAFAGYIVGTSLILGVYYFACNYLNNDFEIFLQSSLISIVSFSYMPNLAIPFDELMKYYQYISLFGIISLPILIWYKKEDWKSSLIFMIYFNLLVFLTILDIKWVDMDTLKQTLSVFIPIMLGITMAIFVRMVYPFSKLILKFKYVTFPIFSIILLSGLVYSQKDILSGIKKSEKTPQMVLDVYDNIYHDFFPYTYAVINDAAAQPISLDKHFFINYDEFIYEYLESDSIYHANRKVKNYFLEHPKDMLPKSVLVFVYDDDENNSDKTNKFSQHGDLEEILMEQINTLKKRGRKINLYYNQNLLRVYEIINEPKSSKIDDLIY